MTQDGPNSKRRNNFLLHSFCDNTSNNNFTYSTDYNNISRECSFSDVSDYSSVNCSPAKPPAVTVQDLAQLLTIPRKNHLPEWKLQHYNGDSLQWHEWIGQNESAIDSASLSNDVKLTYLRTIVTGKAKAAIMELETKYQDALKTLERKFGQPQAVVSAHLDKLNSFPPLKMHNSENVIAFSATISAMVGVFRLLEYEHDWSSAASSGQDVQKFLLT